MQRLSTLNVGGWRVGSKYVRLLLPVNTVFVSPICDFSNFLTDTSI